MKSLAKAVRSCRNTVPVTRVTNWSRRWCCTGRAAKRAGFIRAPDFALRHHPHPDAGPARLQESSQSDYSAGNNLFELKAWDWLVAGSYYNYAVLEPDQVTVTFPERPVRSAGLGLPVIQNAAVSRRCAGAGVGAERALFSRLRHRASLVQQLFRNLLIALSDVQSHLEMS